MGGATRRRKVHLSNMVPNEHTHRDQLKRFRNVYCQTIIPTSPHHDPSSMSLVDRRWVHNNITKWRGVSKFYGDDKNMCKVICMKTSFNRPSFRRFQKRMKSQNRKQKLQVGEQWVEQSEVGIEYVSVVKDLERSKNYDGDLVKWMLCCTLLVVCVSKLLPFELFNWIWREWRWVKKTEEWK